MGVNSDRSMVASEPSVSASEERRCLCIIRDMTNIDEPRREHMNVPASRLCSQFFQEAASLLKKDPDSVTLICEDKLEDNQQIVIENLDAAVTVGDLCQDGRKYTFFMYTSDNATSQDGVVGEEDEGIGVALRGGRRKAVGFDAINDVIECKGESEVTPSATASSSVQPSSYSYSQALTRSFDTGYVGLVNQAMTCYLNSLLQTLYMTPEFRNAVYRWEYDGTEEEAVKSIPFQLQRLFLQLQTSNKRAVETTDITKSFGWDSSEAWQQHDVQELCRVMFDALERKWKNTDQADLINQLYQGQLKDYVKCLACGYESARVDSYLDIPLVVRPFGASHGYASVEEALKAFVEPEILNGTNQYFCERCNAKSDAHKGLKFKTFPYMLTLQLKRFDFDYNSMQRIKLNDRVTFPEMLDVSFLMSDEDDVNKEQSNQIITNGETPAADNTVGSNNCANAESCTGDKSTCHSKDVETLADNNSSCSDCQCNKTSSAKNTSATSADKTCDRGDSGASDDGIKCNESKEGSKCVKEGGNVQRNGSDVENEEVVDEGIDMEDNGHSTINNNSCDFHSSYSASDSDLASYHTAVASVADSAESNASTSADEAAAADSTDSCAAAQTSTGKPGCQYDLLSIMVHSGGAGGGHYYAYIRSFKDGQWYSFNDQNVTVIAQSDIEKTYGNGPSSSYGYYSSYSSSAANAYMLIYRRRDEAKNKKFIEPEDFYPHIVEHLRRLKQKEEDEINQRELERNTCKIGLFYYEQTMEKYLETKLEVHKDLTLAQATEAAQKQLFLTNRPLDCVRLVKYDNVADYIDRSFSEEEMSQPIYEVLGGVRSIYGFDLLMEVKDKQEQFVTYHPGGITLKIHQVTRGGSVGSGTVGPALPLRVHPNQCVGYFKSCVSQLLRSREGRDSEVEGEEHLICVIEKSFRQLHPLLSDDLSLAYEGIGRGTKVYVAVTSDIEEVESCSRSFRDSWLYEQLDQYQNTVHIEVSLPSLHKVSLYRAEYIETTDTDEASDDQAHLVTSSHSGDSGTMSAAPRGGDGRCSGKVGDFEDEGIGESETTSEYTEDSQSAWGRPTPLGEESQTSWGRPTTLGGEMNTSPSSDVPCVNDISISVSSTSNERHVTMKNSCDVELQLLSRGTTTSSVVQLDDFESVGFVRASDMLNVDTTSVIGSSDGNNDISGLLSVKRRVSADRCDTVDGTAAAASLTDNTVPHISNIAASIITQESRTTTDFDKSAACLPSEITLNPTATSSDFSDSLETGVRYSGSGLDRFSEAGMNYGHDDYLDDPSIHEGLSQGSGSSQTVEVGGDIGDLTTESLTDVTTESPVDDDEGVLSVDTPSIPVSPIPPAPPLYVDCRGFPAGKDQETGEWSGDKTGWGDAGCSGGATGSDLGNLNLREDGNGRAADVEKTEEENWDDPPPERNYDEAVERYFDASFKPGPSSKFSEQTLLVHVDKRIRLFQLKDKLESFVGVPALHFKVFRNDRLSSFDGTEETKLYEPIYNFNDDTKLELKLGRALRTGEFKIQLYQLRLNESEVMRAMNEVEPVIAVGMTVAQVKKVISKELHLYCFMQISLDTLRLRLKSFTSPSKILTNEMKVGVDELKHIKELVFEILEGEDPIKPGRSNEQMQIYVRRWSPSKYTMGPMEEIVVNNLSIEELINKIAEKGEIDPANVSFAKVRQTFPGDVSVLEMNNLEWDPNVSRINQWPLSILDDGDVLYYRDKTEREMELSDEERERLTKQENVRLHKHTVPLSSRYVPRKEKALKIYTDDTPSKYPSNSSSSNVLAPASSLSS